MAEIIDVRGLTSEQVEALKHLAHLFCNQQKGERGMGRSGLEASTGGWKGLIDAERLKRDICADRLVRTEEGAP